MLLCSNSQIIWLTLVKFIKKFINIDIKVTTKLLFLNETKNITNKSHRIKVKKAFATGVHFLFWQYYQRDGVLTSSFIAGELSRRLALTFMEYYNLVSHMDLDVELSSNELKLLVEGMDDIQLRRGAANAVIWLKGYGANLREPDLELTED